MPNDPVQRPLELLHHRKSRLSRNSTLAFVPGIVGIGIYFLTMRFVVRIAGLEGVGLWSLTMGFVAFLRVMDLTGANGLARMVATNTKGDY